MPLPPAFRPRAVIFDMDGLLLDSERVARDLYQAVSAEMGYPMSDAVFASLVGIPEDGNRAQLAAAFGTAFDYDALRRGTLARRDAQYGDHLPLKPGALAAVAAVAALGLPAAVATSTERRFAEPELAATGILPHLVTLVGRNEVARGKPFPDLYLEAARRLGTPPADCLALEDSYNGVRAAAAAGVPVIMIPDLLPPTDDMRDLALAVMPDLDSVVAWLTALFETMA
ncbi:hypothetical protein IP88_15155 [alpha proteobacterium AAP81b]|nr:hypothetical protein IP88_15155 [alpha proteobacterium AAP81b]